jgi:hypothetical protein
MGVQMYLILTALLFLLAVFGLGWYQKRKKTVKSRLKLVVSNDRPPAGSAGQDTTFERHLQAVRSSKRQRDADK